MIESTALLEGGTSAVSGDFTLPNGPALKAATDASGAASCATAAATGPALDFRRAILDAASCDELLGLTSSDGAAPRSFVSPSGPARAIARSFKLLDVPSFGEVFGRESSGCITVPSQEEATGLCRVLMQPQRLSPAVPGRPSSAKNSTGVSSPGMVVEPVAKPLAGNWPGVKICGFC